MRSPILTFVTAALVSAVLLAMPATAQAQALDDDEQSVLAEIRNLLDRLSDLLDSLNTAFAKLDADTPPSVSFPPPTGGTDSSGIILDTGFYTRTGTERYDEYSLDHFGRFSGTRDTYSFSSWGVWATGDGGTLFRATITGTNIQGGLSTALFDPYSTSVTGLRSFSNPRGRGTAIWTGDVRAYETHPDTFGTPVEGDARLEIDLDGLLDTIDVDFTNFDRGHADMSWNNLFVSLGGFRAFYPGDLEGDFYGDGHEGVAGTFERDSLKGIFGALRE